VQNSASRVTSSSIIEIKPHRYGWTCGHCGGGERVFILKSQAIRYAQQQCVFVAAEIRIWDHNGALERHLINDPAAQAMSA
jgi:hypothetical protein